MEPNTLFPIFLKLDRVNFLIIGGKEIAEEKLYAVLKCYPDAEVTLIARNYSEPVKQIASTGKNITVLRKDIEESDFNHKRFVIAATANRELNEFVYGEARKRNIPVNIADMPDICEFYLGSIVSKGDLRIAISTNGKSPTLAKRLREFFENNLPDELEGVINDLGIIRKKLRGDFKAKVRKLREITSVLSSEN